MSGFCTFGCIGFRASLNVWLFYLANRSKYNNYVLNFFKVIKYASIFQLIVKDPLSRAVSKTFL